MAIKTVLFDFDGVLTTDYSGSLSICKYIAKATGVDFGRFSLAYRRYNGDLLNGRITHDDIWQELCEDVGAEIDIGVLHDSFIDVPFNRNMILLAGRLKKKGYSVGIVTDNKKDRMDAIASHFGLHDLFDAVIVSAEIGFGKGGREIFIRAMRELAAKADECLFIDNMEKNLIVPRELGMGVIYYDQKENDFDGLMARLGSFGVIA